MTEGSSLPGDRQARREAIAARTVGRWHNGTSLVRYPDRPGTTQDAATGATVDHAPDNDFMYGAEDPAARRCPLGAHIRRANPRDGLAPGSPEQLAIVNSHRMLRVGRSYAPRDGTPGLLFMCVNVDIERQFEFVQESWLHNPSFAGLERETDPLLGHERPPRCFTVDNSAGPLRLAGLAEFVRMRGGGYFFLPSRTAYRFLVTFPAHAAASPAA
jgi:deferrochelatase/peroxidase EfeB